MQNTIGIHELREPKQDRPNPGQRAHTQDLDSPPTTVTPLLFPCPAVDPPAHMPGSASSCMYASAEVNARPYCMAGLIPSPPPHSSSLVRRVPPPRYSSTMKLKFGGEGEATKDGRSEEWSKYHDKNQRPRSSNAGDTSAKMCGYSCAHVMITDGSQPPVFLASCGTTFP